MRSAHPVSQIVAHAAFLVFMVVFVVAMVTR